jgi:hypothetical protein
MSIVDASIFTHEKLFLIPSEYRFVEDLWLSYVIQVAPDWGPIGRLMGLEFDREIELSKEGQWNDESFKDTKIGFFTLLRNCKLKRFGSK